MNSICLSVAPNLRCQGLTKLENFILLAPPALEVLFSLTLAFTNSSIRGRKRWLLVLDGLAFFLLALADTLAHVIPDVTSSVLAFRIFDLSIAGASFIPILAYTLFLALFSHANLVKYIPSRFSRVIMVTLFVLIPFIVASNEIGSLLGITHTKVKLSNLTTVLGIEISSITMQRIASFFSFLAVTLLTLFQATNFVLSFVRVVRAFVDARRAEPGESSPEGKDEIHLFRGLGWVSAGLKLGAIETVVGFADINFGVALTRRILRFFGRAMLIIGVIKGMNIVEDFSKFESEFRGRRSESSDLKSKDLTLDQKIGPRMISFPRNSTFQQMSPNATAFHDAQRTKRTRKQGPSPLALGANSSFNRFNNVVLEQDVPTKTPTRRVTIKYDGATPPVLDVRFSTLSLGAVPVPVPDLPRQPEKALSIVMEDPREDGISTRGPSPLNPPHPIASFASTDSSPRSFQLGTATRNRSSSIPSAVDSIEAVREIAGRFPNLPPRVGPGRPIRADMLVSRRDSDAEWRMLARARSTQRRQEMLEKEQRQLREQLQDEAFAYESSRSQSQVMMKDTSTTDISPVNSIKRKPVPKASSPTASSPSVYGPDPDIEEMLMARQKGSGKQDLESNFYSSDEDEDDSTAHGTPSRTPGLTRSETFEAPVPTTPRNNTPLLTRTIKLPTGRGSTAFEMVQPPPQAFVTPDRRQRQPVRVQLPYTPTNESDAFTPTERKVEQEMGFWLRNRPLSELQKMAVEENDESDAVLDEAWKRAGLTRIRSGSVNQVRVHTTPHAERMFDPHTSLVAEEDEDIGSLPGMPASLDDNRASLLKKPARLDSGVFGRVEGGQLRRQGVRV